MGDYKEHVNRFYSMALGKEKNFQAETNGLITSGDATPSVRNLSLLYTNNTSDTEITDFDDGAEGQVIRLVMIDNSTTVAAEAPLYLQGSGNLKGSNNTLSLIQRGTGWYELSRGYNQNGMKSISVTGASTAANFDYANVAVISANSADCDLQHIDGGYVGQSVLITNGSGGSGLKVTTGDTIFMFGTNSVTVDTAMGLKATKVASDKWIVDGQIS